MPARQAGQKCAHWRQIEQRNYFYFMIVEADLLEKPNKKKTRFFQKMAKFIHGRSNKQCRTHHFKKARKFKKKHQEKLYVYKLYHRYCKMRLIGEQHLKQEIAKFIGQSLSDGLMTCQKASQYLAKLDQNIQRLQLEETCRSYEQSHSKRPIPAIQLIQAQIVAENIDQDIFFHPEEKSTSIRDATSSLGESKQAEMNIDSYLNQYGPII